MSFWLTLDSLKRGTILNQRTSLDCQNKELKTKLQELESERRSKTRGVIQGLEAKVATLDE